MDLERIRKMKELELKIEELKETHTKEELNILLKNQLDLEDIDIRSCFFYILAGADIDTRNNKGATTFMIAVMKKDLEATKLLIDKGADIEAVDKEDNTPLIAAADLGYIEIVNLLIEKGADVKAANENGITSLILAANKGHIEIVNLLIEKGADIDVMDKEEDTALILALDNEYKEIAKLLIEKGANVKAADEGGITALMLAADRGYKEIAKLLIDKGADIDAMDKEGNTALQRALFNGNEEMFVLLIKEGASLDPKINGGVSVFRADKPRKNPDHINIEQLSENSIKKQEEEKRKQEEEERIYLKMLRSNPEEQLKALKAELAILSKKKGNEEIAIKAKNRINFIMNLDNFKMNDDIYNSIRVGGKLNIFKKHHKYKEHEEKLRIVKEEEAKEAAAKEVMKQKAAEKEAKEAAKITTEAARKRYDDYLADLNKNPSKIEEELNKKIKEFKNNNNEESRQAIIDIINLENFYISPIYLKDLRSNQEIKQRGTSVFAAIKNIDSEKMKETKEYNKILENLKQGLTSCENVLKKYIEAYNNLPEKEKETGRGFFLKNILKEIIKSEGFSIDFKDKQEFNEILSITKEIFKDNEDDVDLTTEKIKKAYEDDLKRKEMQILQENSELQKEIIYNCIERYKKISENESYYKNQNYPKEEQRKEEEENKRKKDALKEKIKQITRLSEFSVGFENEEEFNEFSGKIKEIFKDNEDDVNLTTEKIKKAYEDDLAQKRELEQKRNVYRYEENLKNLKINPTSCETILTGYIKEYNGFSEKQQKGEEGVLLKEALKNVIKLKNLTIEFEDKEEYQDILSKTKRIFKGDKKAIEGITKKFKKVYEEDLKRKEEEDRNKESTSKTSKISHESKTPISKPTESAEPETSFKDQATEKDNSSLQKNDKSSPHQQNNSSNVIEMPSLSQNQNNSQRIGAYDSSQLNLEPFSYQQDNSFFNEGNIFYPRQYRNFSPYIGNNSYSQWEGEPFPYQQNNSSNGIEMSSLSQNQNNFQHIGVYDSSQFNLEPLPFQQNNSFFNEGNIFYPRQYFNTSQYGGNNSYSQWEGESFSFQQSGPLFDRKSILNTMLNFSCEDNPQNNNSLDVILGHNTNMTLNDVKVKRTGFFNQPKNLSPNTAQISQDGVITTSEKNRKIDLTQATIADITYNDFENMRYNLINFCIKNEYQLDGESIRTIKNTFVEKMINNNERNNGDLVFIKNTDREDMENGIDPTDNLLMIDKDNKVYLIMNRPISDVLSFKETFEQILNTEVFGKTTLQLTQEELTRRGVNTSDGINIIVPFAGHSNELGFTNEGHWVGCCREYKCDNNGKVLGINEHKTSSLNNGLQNREVQSCGVHAATFIYDTLTSSIPSSLTDQRIKGNYIHRTYTIGEASTLNPLSFTNTSGGYSEKATSMQSIQDTKRGRGKF